jgi:Tfp pilus assembly protein PilF
LAAIYSDRGEPWSAVAYLGRAVTLDPFNWATLTALARAMLDVECAEMAIRMLQEALALNPAEASVHATLGEAYRLDREYELSVECFKQALALDPRSVAAAHGLAKSLIQLGRIDEAADALNRLAADGCRDADVLLTLCRLPASAVRVDLLAIVDQGVSFRGRDDGDRMGFLRAAALHLQGRHEDCWNCLVEANGRMFAKTRDAYHGGAAARSQVLKQLSEPAEPALPQLTASGHAAAPLFILGPPRSGKSTLEALLTHTSGVHRGFESPIVRNAARRTFQAAGLPTSDRMDNLPEDLERPFAMFFHDELRRRSGDARLFTMTAYGALRAAPRLARIIPQARFVFVSRNRDDHVFSIFFQHYGLAMDYAYDIAAIREFIGWYAAMGEAMARRFPGAVRVLDYETIVSRPAEAVAAVGELCGFPFAPPQSPAVENDAGWSRPYRAWLT